MVVIGAGAFVGTIEHVLDPGGIVLLVLVGCYFMLPVHFAPLVLFLLGEHEVQVLSVHFPPAFEERVFADLPEGQVLGLDVADAEDTLEERNRCEFEVLVGHTHLRWYSRASLAKLFRRR